MVANVATFQDLLIHFSFSQEARTAIIANGLTTNQDLIGLKYKDIDNIMKIVHASRTPPMIVPYIAQKKLITLAYWVNHWHRLAEMIDSEQYTHEVADDFSCLMSYENPVRRTANDSIPLAYVIREVENPDPEQIYKQNTSGWLSSPHYVA
jgi:hypothetical protein